MIDRCTVVLALLASCGLAYAQPVPADRGVWNDHDFEPEDPPASIVRDGWTIPGDWRRSLRNRWGNVTRGKLKRKARDGDVYDKIFLGEAYERGHHYFYNPGMQLFGLRRAIASGLHSVFRSERSAEKWYRRACGLGAARRSRG